MRYAVLENDVVVNVVVADPEFADEHGYVECPDHVGIGFTFDGDTFTPPPPAAPVVPETVTRRQAKEALRRANKLHLVQQAIDAIPDQSQREMMQIEWDESLEFYRHRPSLIAMATAIGLDSDGLDALFIAADKLP